MDNGKWTKRLHTIYKTRLNELRDGIHVSPLIYCLLKAHYHQEQGTYDMEDENSWHTLKNGEYWHLGVQKDLVMDQPNTYVMEKQIIYEDIIGHPDVIDNVDNEILELKTVKNAYALTYPSKKIVPKNMSTEESGAKPKHHHLIQLKSYMAITGIPNGTLLYHPLSTVSGEKELYEFPIKIDEAEAISILAYLRERKKQLLEDPYQDIDRVTKDWNENWQCSYCPFATQEKCPQGYEIAQKRSENRKQYIDIPFRTKAKKQS